MKYGRILCIGASVMDEIKKLAKKVDMIQRDLDSLKLSLSKGFQTKKWFL